MARYAAAALVFVALAAGVWWFLVSDATPTTTTPVAAPPASTTTPPSTSTTVSANPTTTASHVVETVEEAEAILRDLWFGWFEGIYNQDEDRIREVVIGEHLVEVAVRQFGKLEFLEPPQPGAISFSGTVILRSDRECLAVWQTASAETLLGSDGVRSGVDVLRYTSIGHWRIAGSWLNREDQWGTDCESSLP